MDISAEKVKELREKTGAGMMDCKKALAQAKGDFDEATRILREKGLAAAAKRSGRATSEGQVASYIHPGARVGVLIEVNCETDFVARNELFQQLVRDLAMHVAATAPLCVRREEVPADLIAQERAIYRAQALEQKKPEPVVEKIVEGRVEKYYKEVVLLEQPFVKDPDRTVEQLVKEVAARLGENVQVRRFARFQLGG